jgi:DNA-directed RNA polymerase specialized sigma24 family protein
MRRSFAYSTEAARLCVYRRIIRYYLRYVLVRCAKFTNRKREAQTIAFYALVTTCLLAPQLPHARQLRILVDMMVRIVARDQIRLKSKTRREQHTPTDIFERLLATERMRKLAQAMNMLDGVTRELLVLYHIEMIGLTELSRLFERPAGEIAAHITAGRQALATRLQQLCSNHSGLHRCHVALLLDEFRAYLDAGSAERLGRYALSYVTKWGKDNRRAPPWRGLN